jgi:hypothetical protein
MEYGVFAADRPVCCGALSHACSDLSRHVSPRAEVLLAGHLLPRCTEVACPPRPQSATSPRVYLAVTRLSRPIDKYCIVQPRCVAIAVHVHTGTNGGHALHHDSRSMMHAFMAVSGPLVYKHEGCMRRDLGQMSDAVHRVLIRRRDSCRMYTLLQRRSSPLGICWANPSLDPQEVLHRIGGLPHATSNRSDCPAALQCSERLSDVKRPLMQRCRFQSCARVENGVQAVHLLLLRCRTMASALLHVLMLWPAIRICGLCGVLMQCELTCPAYTARSVRRACGDMHCDARRDSDKIDQQAHTVRGPLCIPV